MILSFKHQFKRPILNGSKIHTIRADKGNRWKAGNKIHFAVGLRTPRYNCFKTGICVSVQKIKIEYAKNKSGKPIGKPLILIDDSVYLDDTLLNAFVAADGFSSLKAFFEWFDTDFEGKIIHWTDFKY